jgi:hypothetical protein
MHALRYNIAQFMKSLLIRKYYIFAHVKRNIMK